MVWFMVVRGNAPMGRMGEQGLLAMGVHRGVCAKPSEIFLFNRNKRRSQELYQNVSNNTFVKKWRELPRVSCDDGDALSHRAPPQRA